MCEQLAPDTEAERAFAEIHYPDLNVDQRRAVDEMKAALTNEEGGEAAVRRCVFIDGPGGTGKTHLYRVLLARVHRGGGIALAVAFSGNAAT